MKKKEIEDCIRETVLYFYRLMIHGQPVTFPLRGIGVLGIQNKIVTMTFCREFLQATDGSRNLASMLRKVSQSLSWTVLVWPVQLVSSDYRSCPGVHPGVQELYLHPPWLCSTCTVSSVNSPAHQVVPARATCLFPLEGPLQL